MKILSKRIDFKNKIFIVRDSNLLNQVRMVLEIGTDDLWNVYNLISIGDMIKGSVYRQLVDGNLVGKYRRSHSQGQCIM